MTGSVRHLPVDLGELDPSNAVEVRSWSGADPTLDSMGAWGGPAAGLVELARNEPGLQIAVGPAVGRGLPTAARATVRGRSPLTGRLAEGLVGSDLALRLTRSCDLVTLRGRATIPSAVLVIEAGRARLSSRPELAGADPVAVHEHLTAALGPCATLRAGPAAEAGVRWANLAAGADPLSFVGRGGLGALLARHGLKAIAVLDEPREDDSTHDALAERLASSPRLVARAVGGTFELAHARGARGDLRGPDGALDAVAGADFGDAVASKRRGRHGCHGCPTPCGWTFEVPDTPQRRQGARFSAVHALGLALGLGADDALALLERCNEYGVDAKEAGAVLALAVSAGEARAGARTDFEALLARVGRGELALEGAAAFARERGLEDPTAGGEAVRDERDLAALLGTCVAVRGAEPMRSSPFLVEGGADRARLTAVLDGLPLPAGAEDPRDPAGKGRLVWWHENLAAAVDASGFCAFAAAGALADGVASVDDLADWLEPGLDGQGLLRRGATLVALAAEVGDRFGASRTPPAWAAEALAAPGMWPEYRALRGLDEWGALRPEARAARLLSAPFLPTFAPDLPASARAPELGHAHETRTGEVTLGAVGSLARALGPGARLRTILPAELAVVLRSASRRFPDASELRGDAPPSVYRDGRRLDLTDLVHDGDHLDLVVAVSGG